MSLKELATALAKAQTEIKSAIKDAPGQVGNQKYKYADLTCVWDACRVALTKNGLSIVQRTDFAEGEMWLETMLLHASGESIVGRYPLRPQQQTPQGMGSAMTYARRYALAAMVGVVADEDDDGKEASQGKPQLAVVEASSTMAGRKNEADGVRRAREWANNAHEALKKMKKQAELDEWLGASVPTLEKLRGVVPDEAVALDDRIKATAGRLNVLAAW